MGFPSCNEVASSASWIPNFDVRPTERQNPSTLSSSSLNTYTNLLDQLYAKPEAQRQVIDASGIQYSYGFDNILRDKFIALDQYKYHFLYQLCRSIDARDVVEAGTSFGFSTIIWN